MEVLHIASLEGVRVPVVAAGADTDDTTLAVVGRILPCDDGTVTADTEDGSTGASLPSGMVGVVSPVRTDMVLGGRVGDVVTGIGGVNMTCLIAGNKIL